LRGGFRHVSNSTVAAIGKDGPRLIPLEDSYTTIPTVLFFRDDDNNILYGRAAIAEYVGGGEGRHMRALKSTPRSELEVRSFLALWRSNSPFSKTPIRPEFS
jgi:hypothetical protein